MSRCFPFQPPGYVKEARTYDLELLKKEKDKEKKLKKEKKSREKKEGKDKEKKEKERSDGKHRDKKEKKEKHRGKKEKDRLPRQTEHINGDKASVEKKFPGKSEVNSGEIFIQKAKERDLDRNSISGEKKFSARFSGNSERISQNSHLTEPPKDPKIVQQVDRRIRDEAGGVAKQPMEKPTGTDARKDEGMVKLVAKSTGASTDGNKKKKRGDGGKLDDQGIKDGSRFTATVVAQTVPGMVQPTTDRTSKPLEKDGDKRIEGKEKGKQKEGDDRREEKRKDKYKEKEGHGKEKDRDKEKKKEEKAKEKSEHKKTEPDKLKESSNDGLTGISSTIPGEGTKNPLIEGNLKKRKDSDSNGFLSACDIKLNKVPKPTSSFPLTQNGKILVTPQNSIPGISGRQVAVNNFTADGKEKKINGIIEAPVMSTSLTTLPPSIPVKPLLTSAKADQIAEPSRKLPHPDTKYLSELFTVPKMDEWSGVDDQEWLFQGCDSQSKRPKVCAFGIDETPQVWSEALRIESADVCAMPYVIPY